MSTALNHVCRKWVEKWRGKSRAEDGQTSVSAEAASTRNKLHYYIRVKVIIFVEFFYIMISYQGKYMVTKSVSHS